MSVTKVLALVLLLALQSYNQQFRPRAAAGGTVTVTGSVSTNSANNSVSTMDVTHSVASGVETLVVVITHRTATATTVSDVTWDPATANEPLTLEQRSTNGSVVSEVWYRISPSTGTTLPVRINMTASALSVAAAAVNLDGSSTSDPTRGNNTATGTTTDPSTSITSATGDLVIDVVASRPSATITVGADQTEIWNANSGGPASRNHDHASSYESGATSVTMSWSGTGDTQWAQTLVSFQP